MKTKIKWDSEEQYNESTLSSKGNFFQQVKDEVLTAYVRFEQASIRIESKPIEARKIKNYIFGWIHAGIQDGLNQWVKKNEVINRELKDYSRMINWYEICCVIETHCEILENCVANKIILSPDFFEKEKKVNATNSQPSLPTNTSINKESRRIKA